MPQRISGCGGLHVLGNPTHVARRPARGRAQHSCRPCSRWCSEALGSLVFHRSGEPGASRLPSRKRCRGRGAGPLDTGTPHPFGSRAALCGARTSPASRVCGFATDLRMAAMFPDGHVVIPASPLDIMKAHRFVLHAVSSRARPARRSGAFAGRLTSGASECSGTRSAEQRPHRRCSPTRASAPASTWMACCSTLSGRADCPARLCS